MDIKRMQPREGTGYNSPGRGGGAILTLAPDIVSVRFRELSRNVTRCICVLSHYTKINRELCLSLTVQ